MTKIIRNALQLRPLSWLCGERMMSSACLRLSVVTSDQKLRAGLNSRPGGEV